ncbi:pinensin family lanthipeptide [Mucilaginibacter sp. KACC 22063]|uniref:pinensin family lanthipeptide n=1 Tax=Mucilaginibacter sp. KACC 22063 TaxID=3025666 RepID=UPI0023651152|nr:pinensin family lanthipeptide [Mucilaginibacter sp. KACC 22063]WDF55248.1 pinensin family lanthipeptide [Mucilaginibacter sp. KACC 22063]
MKKKLDLSELKVQSFITSLDEAQTKSVKGMSTGTDPTSQTNYVECCNTTFDPWNTSATCSVAYCATTVPRECDATGMYYATCDGSCPTQTPGYGDC